MQNHEDEGREVKNAEPDREDQNATNGKAGSEEMGSMPNDPAENAKKTSPEEDAGEKEDTRLSADN
ncbi:hypothetical protein L0657_08280 [Dyadobacter sp. CY345]|uniref:hypothetical protein n=1 Tax=Dyadobacter sp. CY345 TaxID=2909335 RepID=UPI001F2BF6CA|nr:hypothetical protein [Dyadobacter sp. CY345]MCF2443948.1 hypothetical protein [Dyadobacter sp. CY345]